MEAFLNIKYKQVSASDNYEDFLKFCGLNVLMRKGALTMSPVFILTKEGDTYTVTMTTPVKTMKTSFKLNEEFDEEKVDGTKVKSIVTVEGNKMIHVQTDGKGNKLRHVRDLSADKVVMSITADNWDGVCTRQFEKID